MIGVVQPLGARGHLVAVWMPTNSPINGGAACRGEVLKACFVSGKTRVERVGRDHGDRLASAAVRVRRRAVLHTRWLTTDAFRS